MFKFFIALTLIIGMIITYNFFNPPRSAMELSVPIHTLKRLGFNEGDLSFMLSDDSSCNNKFSKNNHNYTVMFGDWRNRSVLKKHVTLYLTWQDILQITDEIHLCIRFKEKWEAVWKGKFSLKGTLNLYMTHMRFFCNKKNSSSKWECKVE